MHSVQFTAETSSRGVLERDFTVGEVTGVLWSPACEPGNDSRPGTGSRPDAEPRPGSSSRSGCSAPTERSEPAPLVLIGHGGGMHKRAPAMAGRAHLLVLTAGFTVATVDAPGHGGRPRTAVDEREIVYLQRTMAAGEPIGPIVVEYNAHLAERAVPEWQATLDALQELPEIGTGGPVGYYGLNLGTAIGVPLVAVEPRITAAALGQFWPESLIEAARRITVPIEFAMQWDDEQIDRQAALALFDAFASKEKTLHANAGGHMAFPRFEADSAVRFFIRHLVRPATLSA